MSDFIEEVIFMDDGQVKINFKKTDGTYTLQDAIHMPRAAYDALSEAEVEAMKQQRFDNWITIITTPAPEPEVPLVEEVVIEEVPTEEVPQG